MSALSLIRITNTVTIGTSPDFVGSVPNKALKCPLFHYFKKYTKEYNICDLTMGIPLPIDQAQEA